MSFFSSLFASNNDPIATLHKLVERQAWAEVAARAATVDRSQLQPEQCAALEQMTIRAGDGLARLNLFEGDAQANSGDWSLACEHYRLALGQARSSELVAEIQERLHVAPDSGEPLSLREHAGCGAGHCGSAAAGSSTEATTLDEEERLELIAAACPGDTSIRYRQLRGPLLQAVLLAHEDRFDAASSFFAQVPAAAQNELFFFERGSLLARHGEAAAAIADLQTCLARYDYLPALESLVDLYLSRREPEPAAALLLSEQGQRLPKATLHAQLARVEQGRGNPEQALAQALQALQHGSKEPDIVLLAASIHESRNDFDAAERLLALLSGGGCSGGSNLHLAEFRFRHRRDLPAALEGFKTAARHEPDNPFWWLRIGQIYLRLGWVKEGKPLLVRVAADTAASEQVRNVALDELSGL